MRTTLRLMGAVFALGLTSLANATVFTLNFETFPNLPLQPSAFGSIPMQTYSTAGLYTISGGVALGNPSFLASFAAQGSSPNLYGTTDIADPSLLDTITLDLDPLQLVTNVSGKLFNGQGLENYVVRYLSGIILLNSQALNNVADNNSATGFANFAFVSSIASPITRVQITSPNTLVNGWDFFVDNVSFTTNPSTGVPEPSTFLLLSAGLLVFGCRHRIGMSLKKDHA